MVVAATRGNWLLRSPRREWAVILLLAVLLVPASFIFAFLTLGSLFIVVYVSFLFIITIWNTWVVLGLAKATWEARRHNKALLVHMPLLTFATASVVLWGAPFDLPTRPKVPLEVGASLAMVYACVQFVLTARRSHRDYFAPIYNLFNLIFLGAWTHAEQGLSGDPGPLAYAFARSSAMFQMVNISFLAAFAPIFILPSYLPKVKGLRWPRGVPLGRGFGGFLLRLPTPARTVVHKVAWVQSKTSGGLVLYAGVALLVLLPLAAGGVGSFYSINPTDLPYGHYPGSRFSATAGAFTDVTKAPANWRDLVNREIALAKDLGLGYLRYDLKTEFLRDNQSLGAFDEGVLMIRGAGLEVILSPFGSESWANVHPSFEVLNATIAEDSLFLAQRYHPAYLFPFFEPNGQVALNLGHGMPTPVWMGAIEAVTNQIKEVSPGTGVLIEIADDLQGPDLARNLFLTAAPVDAVGFDLYPGSASDLDKIGGYANLSHLNPSREFWVSEFGLEAIQFGEVAQARAVAKMLSLGSTRWNVTGFNIWALEDNAGVGLDKPLEVGLGITALDGRKKPAFAAYQAGIIAIRGA